MDFLPLADLNPEILFNYIGIIPYVVIDEIAYPLIGVSGKIPTLVDLGSSKNKNSPIHFEASNIIYTKTCRLLSISPDDFLNNAYILYRNNRDDGQQYLTGVLFICLDIANSFDELNGLCYQFRKNFITEHISSYSTDYCDNTHLLWMSQRNFIYIIRNTTYSDGQLDENGNELKKPNPSGNIPIDNDLKEVYSILDGDIPINSVYNKNAHVPQYLVTYPEMDPFLRKLLGDAFNEKIDFFFTLYG